MRETDPAMPGNLRDALRKAADPIANDTRRAALALPARGRKHTGLRGRVAAGVSVQPSTTTDIGVRFTTSMADPQEAELPRGLDNGVRGWRHPVFGNSNNWVQQRGGSWFRSTIADDGPQVERALTDVLEQAAASIAAAGIGP
ncbi:hypothetical protein ACGFZA_16020 [Streptomyces sp. NPDC048211]|uniref:hypothetical protein n=1 Tax=Streptomyces sp. NPDC048211 TaxID=3365516 RepID=UPI00371E3BDB